jgi:hypothetical protein
MFQGIANTVDKYTDEAMMDSALRQAAETALKRLSEAPTAASVSPTKPSPIKPLSSWLRSGLVKGISEERIICPGISPVKI